MRIFNKIKEHKKIKQEYEILSDDIFIIKIFKFIVIKFYDIFDVLKNGRPFNEYGLTVYCGRQGAGKTIAMTEYLERMRKKYPDCLIITNYGYCNEDMALTDWNQIFTVKNGEKGVIFAVDEIQNEYSSADWKNFPEWLLAEVTQQRKQKVKIVATSQVFTRVVKQLREQAFTVVECRTLANRWTFTRCFDAEDYNAVIDSPEQKLKLRRLYRKSFIQTKKIRELYNSYAKIERLARTEKNIE